MSNKSLSCPRCRARLEKGFTLDQSGPHHRASTFWACDGGTLHRDTGFAPACSLRERLAQTVQWYCEQGWLKPVAEPVIAN